VDQTAFRLDGQVALVNGASRGIGKAIALALADAGADVAVAARTEDALEATAVEVRGRGRRGLSVPTDVSRYDQVERMVDRTVGTLGRLDILVNAAGVAGRTPAIEITEADFDRVYGTNIKGITFACSVAGRHIVGQRSGRVINIASITTQLGIAGRSLYGPTKAAIGQLTKSLAVEWGPRGVCVNAIAPGWIVTEFTRPLLERPEVRDWILGRTPLGRLGQPDDLIGLAVFLASPASAFLTGQIIYVDGGFTAG
jgi:NAD(P)-dependent dehydrogenase (short-subunit alcohol dehydrogenase family)